MVDAVEKYKVMRGMRDFGGDFVYQLSLLLECADAANTAKIKAAWPDEWQRYLEIYEAAAAAGKIR